MFEERPEEYAERAASFGLDLDTPQKEGTLKLESFQFGTCLSRNHQVVLL